MPALQCFRWCFSSGSAPLRSWLCQAGCKRMQHLGAGAVLCTGSGSLSVPDSRQCAAAAEDVAVPVGTWHCQLTCWQGTGCTAGHSSES
jgi:hypothetical protein